MSTNSSLQTILEALPGVTAKQVVFSADGSVATVSLREDQLADALRDQGRYVRDAAIATGVRIDISMAKNTDAHSQAPWWKFWQ